MSVDTAVGFPKSREEMYEFYGFIRKQTRDAASKEGGELEFPAGYMFKDVPKWDAEGMDDPVQILLAELDRHNIRQAIVTPYDGPARARRCASTPTGSSRASTSTPTKAWRRCARSTRPPRSTTSSACTRSPPGLYPQVAINDKKFYPIYMKCVELDIPFCSTAGVPGPRIPYEPQDVAHIDEVCWFFPELKFVTRHGCEPWADLAVKLLLKWPNLYYSTTAFAPKYYPTRDHRLREHARRRQGDLVGLLPRRASRTTASSREMPDVPFRDHVWPKFLRENAQRVFKLPTCSEPDYGSRSPADPGRSSCPNIGPVQFAGMLLADMGAEVLRLDRATDVATGRSVAGFVSPYSVIDRGRRSVGIDLKHERRRRGRAAAVRAGRRAARRLPARRRRAARRRSRRVPRPQPAARLRAHDGLGPGRPARRRRRPRHQLPVDRGRARGTSAPKGDAPVPPINLLADFGGGGSLVVHGHPRRARRAGDVAARARWSTPRWSTAARS